MNFFGAIITKQFQCAELQYECILSGTIAEGSMAEVIDGHKYNHVVKFDKLVYEALMQLTWQGFQLWLKDIHAADIDQRSLVIQKYSYGKTNETELRADWNLFGLIVLVVQSR